MNLCRPHRLFHRPRDRACDRSSERTGAWPILLLIALGCAQPEAAQTLDLSDSSVSPDAAVDGDGGLDAAADAKRSATTDTTPGTTADTSSSADTQAPLVTFAIAAIADPHHTGTNLQTTRYKRLLSAVKWLNDNAAARKIKLVLVLGDIAWSGGLPSARAALDTLTVPYVPTIGDNCLFAGDQKPYDDTFGPVYAGLDAKVANLSRAPTPTVHGTTGSVAILQNVAFDLEGLRIIALDISPRTKLGPFGEQGDLHDYPGGTWPWFKAELAKLKGRAAGSVLLASHIPMHRSAGGFTLAQMKLINAAVDAADGLVYANIAGHYHFDFTYQTPDMSYVSLVVGSVFDGPVVVHVATATVGGKQVEWQHETVHVPGWD